MLRDMPQGINGKFSAIVNGTRHTWFIQNLITATKDLPIIEVPLPELEKHLDTNAWFRGEKKPTLRALISHYERAKKSELKYPIILSDEFGIMDGLHRLLKAQLACKSFLYVVKLIEIPAPDYIGDY